ncbi:MAG: DNRLRE domain-containing protein [Planctomycetota bacterium]
MLSNGAGDHIFAGKTNDGLIRRGVIAFDVSSIPAGSTINDVTLTLNMSRRPQNDTRNVGTHRALADWGEGTSDADQNEGERATSTTGDATWIHTFYDTSLWTAAGGDYVAGASATVANEGFYDWTGASMVADVQAWVDTPATNFGWVLVGDESENKTAWRFDSRTINETSKRPKLTVDYTPGAAAIPVPAASQVALARSRPRPTAPLWRVPTRATAQLASRIPAPAADQ